MPQFATSPSPPEAVAHSALSVQSSSGRALARGCHLSVPTTAPSLTGPIAVIFTSPHRVGRGAYGQVFYRAPWHPQDLAPRLTHRMQNEHHCTSRPVTKHSARFNEDALRCALAFGISTTSHLLLFRNRKLVQGRDRHSLIPQKPSPINFSVDVGTSRVSIPMAAQRHAHRATCPFHIVQVVSSVGSGQ